MPRKCYPLDRRLVYEKHVRFMRPEQIALYALLVWAIDAHGRSFHSEQRIWSGVSTSLNGLWDARDDLIDQNDLLHRRPVCQLLQLLPP